MLKSQVTRRGFVLGSAAALVATRARAQAGPLTAQQVVDRIRAGVGTPWRTTTVDGIKAGDPSTVVKGIATTAMATLEVLRKASAAGRNFIVTQEPVFYSASDAPGDRAADPVYLAKKKLIDDQKLVVFRFSDHWSARKPNESASALASTLGITQGRQVYSLLSGSEPPDWDALAIHAIPATTLGALANTVRQKLGLRGGLRLVGSPSLRVTKVFVSPEGTALAAAVKNLPKADVIIAGEPREWEAIPYTLDTNETLSPKGMIYIGRVVSEEPGMQACAGWLKTLVPGVPVEAIAVNDPYWSPLS
jgi:putative NIF3 family GTP cyclohydrolase 1 type 2